MGSADNVARFEQKNGSFGLSIPKKLINNGAYSVQQNTLIFVEKFNFRSIAALDESTSYLISKEWHQIDYSGQDMTKEKIQSLWGGQL